MPPTDPIDALHRADEALGEAIHEMGDIDRELTARWQAARDQVQSALSYPWTVRP